MTISGTIHRNSGTSSVAGLVSRVRSELGELNTATVTDQMIVDWINDSLGAIGDGWTDDAFSTLSWTDGAVTVDLPTDLVRLVRIEQDDGERMPQHRIWAGKVIFDEPDEVLAGQVRIFYAYRWSSMGVGSTTTIPREAHGALVAYAASRYCRWLINARTRLDRYNTQTGRNAVDNEDLERLAALHREEFERYKLELIVQNEPAAFYGEADS